MPKQFHKIKECGCIVKAISCGIKITDNGNMYLLGGHNHFTICEKCKETSDDMYDMWMNDNLTNEFGYAGWKEHK